MSAALALEGVSLAYRGRTVLDAVTLHVAAGEVLGLLGPSASGKTSLVRVLLGFAVPHAGTVRLGDRVVSRDRSLLVAPEDRGLAVVFQDLALWPHLTVEGNLAFGLDARGAPVAERRQRIAAILGRVGLGGTERRYPGELSGGERQRVAIARALVTEPRALLLDEPLASVDVGLKRELLELLRELLHEHGTTAVHVTHDLRDALEVADRLAVLEAGRVVQQGRLDDLRRAPATPFVRALLEDLSARTSAPEVAENEQARRSR